jgi:hypothetical protein
MGSFTNMSCINVSIGTLNNASFINLSNLTQNLSSNFWSYTPAVQISTTNACITNLSSVNSCITNLSIVNCNIANDLIVKNNITVEHGNNVPSASQIGIFLTKAHMDLLNEFKKLLLQTYIALI